MLILDGGTGRQLHRIGAPFGQPEWSALALIEKPDFVLKVHQEFIAAGADIITTNTYAIVPYHIGEKRFNDDASKLLDLAVKIALSAKTSSNKNVIIAGAVPPLFGSYAPERFDSNSAPKMLHLFKEKLVPHCDIIIAETLSCISEIKEFQKAFEKCRIPLWLSLTLEDNNKTNNIRLRSGETLSAAIETIKEKPIDALLFNCSQPEVMADAVSIASTLLKHQIQVGVYANAFPPRNDNTATSNAELSQIRSDLTPQKYKSFAREWLARGASIIGGCCGVGPEHIKALKQLSDHNPNRG